MIKCRGVETMSKELVIWITIAVYAVFILAVGVFAGRKSKTITDTLSL